MGLSHESKQYSLPVKGRLLAAAVSAIFVIAIIRATPRPPSAPSNPVHVQEGIPPEALRVAVEFSDTRLLSELGGVACTSWINALPHVIIYSDSYTRENLPLESSAARDCGLHVEFSSITSMTIDSVGRRTHLGNSIDLSQLKREVVVKDMARRLEEDRSADKRAWALLTEEDTWWNFDHLLRFLHRVERDTGFDRSNMDAKLPPTLAGAGYVESDADDIVYGPMMIMSKSLLTEIADRLDTCRIHAAHHCFQHQRFEGTGELTPLALHHPDPSSTSIFIPDFALDMAAKAQADKTVIKCQKSYPPECSAICSRRMDVYDGALYNNDHFISMCAHHVPGITSVVVRSLQPHGYAFYGDQGFTVDDSETAVYTMKRNCKARCVYGSASGSGPNNMSKAQKAGASVILSCGDRIKWYHTSGYEEIEAIDQVNRQCIGQCFCEGGSKEVEKELEGILDQRRREADELRKERLRLAAAGMEGQRFFFMQNYNEKGTMPTQEPTEVSPAHLKITVAYHKCYEDCQRYLARYDFRTDSKEAERGTSPIQTLAALVGHFFGLAAEEKVKSAGTVFSPGGGKSPYVCRVGKDLIEYQVPTVVLAGVQKSATSSLFWQMVAEFKVNRGGKEVPAIGFGDAFDDEPAYVAKEKHFFSRWNPEDAATPEWTELAGDLSASSIGSTNGSTGHEPPSPQVHENAGASLIGSTSSSTSHEPSSGSTGTILWSLDADWFDERIRNDTARVAVGQQLVRAGSSEQPADASCCPAAQIIYGVGSDRAIDRCCSDKIDRLTPLRPLGGATWEDYASRCRGSRSGRAPREGLCSMLFVGDSLAQQHFISMVCLAWAETDQEVTMVRENVPDGAIIDAGVGPFDASTWHANIEPYKIKLTFSRSNEPRVLDHIKYRNYDYLLLSAWHHGAFSSDPGWFRTYAMEIERKRRGHPAAHTLFFEETPNHFPGGGYDRNNAYPTAVSTEDGAVCDMSVPGGSFHSDVNEAIWKVKPGSASFRVVRMSLLFDSRGDAHPGTLRGRFGAQRSKGNRDCLHWCILPGVFDGMALATLGSIVDHVAAGSWGTAFDERGASQTKHDDRRLTAVEPRFEDVTGASALRFLQHYPKCNEEKTLLMDGTPNYFFVPQSPLRMLQFYGDQFSKVKTVIMLRDQTERFESYFFHARRQGFLDTSVVPRKKSALALGSDVSTLKGLESIGFATYASLSLQKAKGCISQKPWEPLWPSCGTEGIFSGLYAPQLGHWLNFFQPSQVTVLPIGAFELNNTQVMEELATFVGVHYSKTTAGHFARKNAGAQTHGKEMAEEDEPLRRALDEFYEDDKIETREFLRTSGIRIIPESGGWRQFLRTKIKPDSTRYARHRRLLPY